MNFLVKLLGYLYPGGQMMMPQLPMQPPLARPLFLEHEQRRLQSERNVGTTTNFESICSITWFS